MDPPDPVRQLLSTPPERARSLRAPHWAGIAGLAVALAAAALAIPPLIFPKEDGGAATATAEVTPLDTAIATPATPAASPGASPSGGPLSGRATNPTSANGSPPGQAPVSPSRQPVRTTPPAPTATTQKFTPVSVQAEDPRNSLADGAQVTTCATCDGGARVRYIGRLTVYLDVPMAGNRTVTVTYECGGDRRMRVLAGDGRSWTYDVSGPDWQTPRTVTFEASFPAGRVALGFDGSGHPAPDIDKVTIS